jgi:SET domain-containing protein
MPRKIATRKSAIHGNGMFSVAAIKKGERLIEYKGERRTHEQVDADSGGDVESGHTFLFTLNDEYVIDGARGGNSARWINHSCSPNCEALIEEHDGSDRRKDKVVVEALPEEGLGLPLRFQEVHRDHAPTQALKPALHPPPPSGMRGRAKRLQ